MKALPCAVLWPWYVYTVRVSVKLQRLLKRNNDWIEFYAVFGSISVISRRQLTLLMSFLGFTSTRLGLWSVLPKDTPTKNPEDPVRLEPRAPWLGVKHFTTEPRRTREKKQDQAERYRWLRLKDFGHVRATTRKSDNPKRGLSTSYRRINVLIRGNSCNNRVRIQHAFWRAFPILLSKIFQFWKTHHLIG